MVYEEIQGNKTTMRIGLLVTDNDENYGGEESIRDSIVERLKQTYGTVGLEIVTYFVVNGVFPANTNNFDGFIISGSHFNVGDGLDWMYCLEEFVKEIYRDPNGPKLIGICFGHQLIAKALGGKVGLNPNGNFIWCSGQVEVSAELYLKDYYKKVFGDVKALHIMQSHYEQVLTIPKCARTVGTAPGECEHEILLYRCRTGTRDKILTMQGHPEVTRDKMEKVSLPILKKANKITKEEEDLAIKSFEKEDSDKLMDLLFNFLKA